MNKNTTNIITLDQFKDKHFGVLGTKKRKELEEGYQFFKELSLKRNITPSEYKGKMK